MNGQSIPTLYLVRHGEVGANRADHETVRGWSNPPLDARGADEIQQLAARFLHIPAEFVATSDLSRALVTGQAIAKATGAQLIPTPALRPWNTGVLTGRPKHEAQPDIIHYMSHPEVPVPAGESYGEFYHRWQNTLMSLLQAAKSFPSEPLVAVTHSRNLAALQSVLTGGKSPIVPGGGPAPGSITKVSLGPDGNWIVEEPQDVDANLRPTQLQTPFAPSPPRTPSPFGGQSGPRSSDSGANGSY